MWKAVIIDDDPNVLSGMKKAIPWEALQTEWIGEGSDGQQGLALIRSCQPDIVIVDISMPVMDGLDMIDTLRQEGYSGKCVILSGYSDFEYARRALQLDVDDYLTKPVTVDSLTSVLQRVIAKLNEASKEQLNTYRNPLTRLEQYTEPLGTVSLSGPAAPSLISRGHSIRLYHQIAEAVRNCQESEAYGLIDEFIAEVGLVEPIAPAELVHLGNELWTMLALALYDLGIQLEQIRPPLNPVADLQEAVAPHNLAHWLKSMVSDICQSRLWNENIKHKQAVDFIIKYIHEHYSEEITLGDLCRHVFISQNYLGQIFKNVVGETFNQYVSRIRMEKAKEMVMEGKYYIYEIAEKVGYTNIPYFTTLFKKYTGFTPTELMR